MGMRKELEAEAVMRYCADIKSIDDKIKYQDAARNICKLWKANGHGRNADMDKLLFPRYVFLYLGPFDRMGIEVNFFVEEIEERFELNFNKAVIGEDGPVFKYGPNQYNNLLYVFFMIHQKGTCRNVKKEIEPTVHKNYQTQIICDE
jgi:hypothetical protein